MAAITVVFLLLSLLHFSHARPDGAPTSACVNLTPQNPPHAAGMTTTNPYTLMISGLESANGVYFYTPGRNYTVTLRGSGGEQFRGFLVQLRAAADQSVLGDQLTANSSDIKPHNCMPSTGGFTHTNNSDKNYIQFQWTPRSSGDIVFRYTVVRTRDVHWDAASLYVRQIQRVCTNYTTLGPAMISWIATNTSASFTVRAPSMNGYFAALGFSNNRIMPDSDIVVGAVDQVNYFVDDRWTSVRAMPTPDEQQDITATGAVLANGNITMTFTRPLSTNDTTRDITLTNNGTNCVYFLFARGRANVTTRNIMQHTMENRFVSMQRVCLCGGAGVVASLSVWLLLLITVIQYLL